MYNGAKESNSIHYGKRYNIGDLYVIRPLGNGNYYRYIIHSNLLHNSYINTQQGNSADNYQYSIFEDINACNEYNPDTDIICGICFMPAYFAPDFKSRWLFLPYSYDEMVTMIINGISIFQYQEVKENKDIPRYFPKTPNDDNDDYINRPPIEPVNYYYYKPLCPAHNNTGGGPGFLTEIYSELQDDYIRYIIYDECRDFYYFTKTLSNWDGPTLMSESFDGKETFFKVYKSLLGIDDSIKIYHNDMIEHGAPNNVYMPSSAELIFLFLQYDVIANIITEIKENLLTNNKQLLIREHPFFSYEYWLTFGNYPAYIPAMTFSKFDNYIDGTDENLYRGYPVLFKFNDDYKLQEAWHPEIQIDEAGYGDNLSFDTWIFQL